LNFQKGFLGFLCPFAPLVIFAFGGKARTGLVSNRHHMENYKKTEVLGEGTYGKVYKAQDIRTNEIVALKKTLLVNEDEGVPATTLREVSILRALSDCPYIVKLSDVLHTASRNGKPVLYLVFEYLEHDLKHYMISKKGRGVGLDKKQALHFAYQILLGIEHCHSHGVMHRDLKPQNLLVSKDNIIKLADFGLGRSFSIPIGKYTHEVVTLWYRAPEILLGSKCYSTPIDIWSIGCILAEMITGRPLFCGESEIEQLLAIFRIMGTPSNETWPQVENLRDWHDFPQWKPTDLYKIIPQLGKDGCDLLTAMLQLDPAKRITASDALQHPLFDDIRGEYVNNFTNKENFPLPVVNKD